MRSGQQQMCSSGLQNRRLQVRFLSHLPIEILNSWALQRHGALPILCALTPLDPNGSNTGSRVDAVRMVIDLPIQHGFQRSPPSQ
jgi:hypothetical protein